MNKTVAIAAASLLAVGVPLAVSLMDGPDAAAQVRPLALEGDIVMTVDGKAVALTDADKAEIAQRVQAVKDALPPADQASVDWQAALTAEQRVIVGSNGPEQWTPSALVARWKTSRGTATTLGSAAAELEIALIAEQFLAR